LNSRRPSCTFNDQVSAPAGFPAPRPICARSTAFSVRWTCRTCRATPSSTPLPGDLCWTAIDASQTGVYAGTADGLWDDYTTCTFAALPDVVYKVALTRLSDLVVTLSGPGSMVALETACNGDVMHCASPGTFFMRGLPAADYYLMVDVANQYSLDLVVGDSEHHVYGIDPANGTLKWDTSVDGPVLAPIGAPDTTVYLVTTQNTLYHIDAANGAKLWEKRLVQ